MSYPLSWYAATADAALERAPLDRVVEADAAIVGGGFAGLHTARLLAKRGKRVVLLERRRVGWGASGRNGGFVSPGWAARSAAIVKRLGAGPARELYALSKRGVAIVEEAIVEMGKPELVMGRRKLTVSRTDQGPDFADRTRRLADSLGASFEPWPTDKVREEVRSLRYHQGVHEPNCFHTHPLNLALALAADIEKRGGLVYEGTEAVSLERRGGSWLVDAGAKGAGIRARDVVLAGNADLGPVAPSIAAAVLPVATYVVVTEKLGRRLLDLMPWTGALSDTRRAGDYYRIVDGDRLLWGGRITTRRSVPPRLASLLRADIANVFPSLGEARIDYAWAGTMGYAVHMMPHVGEVEPNLWVCSAFGGHGVAQTAAAADVVAGGIAGESDRWRVFADYPISWAGGWLGRAGTQLAYWSMQVRDRLDEHRQARNAERLRT
jgi:glycine/D-amino acid oxidase-like deaminating enzyme